MDRRVYTNKKAGIEIPSLSWTLTIGTFTISAWLEHYAINHKKPYSLLNPSSKGLFKGFNLIPLFLVSGLSDIPEEINYLIFHPNIFLLPESFLPNFIT